ncbi:hypothetical protein GCM10011611_64540 [Aliidongia dinghuensis]|uniref:DUF488 domain-containing protein n=1 Tax=Aliidongia dinghuensis TaxID=1867774 RepID=A0A8J2Z1H6_9PROT|nr:DUF488 domain-containing protein [Aliidongia dinghuensis]GGF49229.1 hypothetical protein GCM10011611_64540 [Aliidongia dinghuensis]
MTTSPAPPSIGPYFTIGHSTRTVDEFVTLLKEAAVDVLVDVRTVPRSRTNPQFNADTLPDRLAQSGIGYRHLPRLGGLRGHRKGATPSPNGFWENASFRNYADYAMTEEFHAGLEELRSLHREHVCAIMCAEAVWWRCHRRIIADYLLSAGEPVLHILGPHHTAPASLTPGARQQADGTLVYPAEA